MKTGCCDCPYHSKKGVIINCRECMREEDDEEEEDYEAQRTDAAERENHRKDVEDF